MINNIIYILVIWFVISSCVEEEKASIKEPINQRLALAAKEGTTYNNHFYRVVTDSNIMVYRKQAEIYQEASFFLHRGDVIELKKARYNSEFYPINIPDSRSTFYVKSVPGFNQMFEGMRFPIVGIVKSKGVYAMRYNKDSQSYEKFEELKVGTTYFFVIQKDVAYINYWSEKSDGPVTASLGGVDNQLHIIQKEDHRSILKKYKTTFKNIFD